MARMGYLKLTRAGLESVWFQRMTVAGHRAKVAFDTLANAGRSVTARKLWEDMNWNPEGMVTTGPKNAELFLRWARSVDGWRDGYAVFEPTGESRI